jgi:ADP-heptose:LPS heptosyltransferase
MTRHILPMERWKFFCYTILGFLLTPIIITTSIYRRKAFARRSKTPKVLIVPILTRVGDLICATTAFRALKLYYPNSHLSVLVGKKVVDLLKVSPRHDAVININDLPFKGFWGRGRLFWYLYRQGFDAVVSLTNNPFNNLINWFSAAPIRIKTIMRHRSIAERMTDVFSNRKLCYEIGAFLQDHYVRLLQFVGVPFSPSVKEVIPTTEGDKKVSAFFETNRLDSNRPIIGITPSAGHRAKEWPLDRFASLAQGLIEEYQARILLIDAPSNRERVDTVIKFLPLELRPNITAATDFALSDLPSLTKRLDLFIAVDTGLIYIAHALRVPLIDITGPVDPHDQPPEDERSVQVRPPKSMKPVFSVLGSPDLAAYRAAPALVMAITPKDVLDATALLVSRGFVTKQKAPAGVIPEGA